jgi:hypothetical protein
MVELIVTSKSKKSPYTNTIGKENLSATINPHLGLIQPIPLGRKQKLESIRSPFESESLDTEDGQDYIGKDSAEPEDLSRVMKSFPNDTISDTPGKN